MEPEQNNYDSYWYNRFMSGVDVAPINKEFTNQSQESEEILHDDCAGFLSRLSEK